MSDCRVASLGGTGERLRVRIVPAPPLPPETEAAAEERWQVLCAQNPRLFNGRMLAFVAHTERDATLIARVVPYKHLAVQPQVNTGVTQLGVTGLLTRGEGADRCVLLARRGSDTLLYPGRWELAPSGGVDAPREGVDELTVDDLRSQLRAEIREELGVMIDDAAATPIALCHDPAAPSVDVVFRLHTAGEVDPAPLNWEYDEFCWLPLRNLPHALSDIDLIEPSRALLGLLGL